MNKNYVLKLTVLLLMCGLNLPTYVSACKHHKDKEEALSISRQIKRRTLCRHSRHHAGLKKKSRNQKIIKVKTDSITLKTATSYPSQQDWEHTVSPWLTFISPKCLSSKDMTVEGTVYPSSEEAVTGKYTNMDHRACAEINALISNLKKQPGIVVNSVWLTGYSAPKGTPEKSEKAAMKRLSMVKENCCRDLSVNDIPLKLGWISEDWDSIRVLSYRSDIPFRSAVVEIIDHPGITESRERTLSHLDEGIPYAYLKERIYPKVERIKYEVRYRITDNRHQEKDSLSNGGITYEALFASAQHYGHETAIFSDLINMGPRLFPGLEEACINAGAVAVLHRDTLSARKYLEPYATDKEAWCDMGILCLLEGKTESAGLYLMMAADSGSAEAKTALDYLKKQTVSARKK